MGTSEGKKAISKNLIPTKSQNERTESLKSYIFCLREFYFGKDIRVKKILEKKMCILHTETFHMAQQLVGKRDSINKTTLALDSRLL